jgi:hypothetical protein
MNANPQSTVVDVHSQFLRAKGYRNLQEWRNDPQNLYVGRSGIDSINGRTVQREGSIWANPFKVGRDGNLQQCVAQYDRYIREKIARNEVNINELRGKRLGCWCVKDEEVCFDATKPLQQYCCHGEVLLKILSENPR